MNRNKKLIRVVLMWIMSSILLTALGTSVLASNPKYKFVLASHGSEGDPFWTRIKNGMEDAAKLLGVDAVMQYSKGNIGKEVDFVDVAVVAGVDGLGVVISDSDAFDVPIQRAIDAGIVVVAFNTDDAEGGKGNARLAYIGQDFARAGYAIGKRMAELLPEGSHVVCPVEIPGAVYARKRYEGVKKAMDEKGITSEMLDAGYETLALTLSRIEAYLLGHPETDAVVSLGGMPTEMAPLAIEELELKDVLNGGFDITPGIVKNIKEGRTIATVDQQPYAQAFITVVQLYLAKYAAISPMDIDTGSGLVDETNVHIVAALTEKGLR